MHRVMNLENFSHHKCDKNIPTQTIPNINQEVLLHHKL